MRGDPSMRLYPRGIRGPEDARLRDNSEVAEELHWGVPTVTNRCFADKCKPLRTNLLENTHDRRLDRRLGESGLFALASQDQGVEATASHADTLKRGDSQSR